MLNHQYACFTVAAYLAQLAQQGGPRCREIACRALLYDYMATVSRQQASIAYSLADGLEWLDPKAWRLLKPHALGALDALPRPPALSSAAGVANVQLVGEIAYGSFQTELEAIKSAHTVYLFVNSSGGDASIALAFADALAGKQSTALVQGIAFSSGLTIVQACRTRRMVAGGTLMCHAPHAFSAGSSWQLRKEADGLDASVAKHIALYHRSPAAKTWLCDGADHYFDAQQAVAAGLLDEIVPARFPATGEPEPAIITPATGSDVDPDSDLEDVLIELLSRARGQFQDKEMFAAIVASFGRHPRTASAGGDG